MDFSQPTIYSTWIGAPNVFKQARYCQINSFTYAAISRASEARSVLSHSFRLQIIPFSSRKSSSAVLYYFPVSSPAVILFNLFFYYNQTRYCHRESALAFSQIIFPFSYLLSISHVSSAACDTIFAILIIIRPLHVTTCV
jgi:hypothetical protein